MSRRDSDIGEALGKLNREMTWAGKPSQGSLYLYMKISSNFLSSLDHFPPTTDDVKGWISPLSSQSYKRFSYYVLKRLFAANNWRWDIRKPPEPADISPPILEFDTVAYLIQMRDLLDERETAYLALSTTYGFRRAELASLSKENFNHHLVVATVKKGRVRVHSIPEEIKDIVLGYPFRPIDESWLSRIFQRIFRDVELEHQPGYGWHSIRSSLVSQLSLRGVSDSIITKFMGWKVMPTGVGVAKVLGTYVRPPEEEVDKKIFESHPFLPLWRR